MSQPLEDLALRYQIDRARLPSRLAALVRELHLDDETRAHLAGAAARRMLGPRWWMRQAASAFFSDFDANALVSGYGLFLLSSAQWAELLGEAFGRAPAAPGERLVGGALLDVGAGAGDVTSRFARHFDGVTATETSGGMVRRLRRRGYVVVRGDLAELDDAVSAAEGAKSPSNQPTLGDAWPSPGPYRTITALNVLDRCDRPRSLLASLARRLEPPRGAAPGGLLVLATPLPFRPFVYDGPRSLPPRERLDVLAEGWEEALTELVTRELEPAGFEVERLARAPYLSDGDPQALVYELDDAIVLARRRAFG